MASTRRNPDTSAIGRALSVLELVAQSEQPVALTALAQQLSLPKATVHRIVMLLEQQSVLLRDPVGKRFRLGSRFNAIATAAIMNSSIRGARHAILQRLVDEIGETCNLTMLDGTNVIYIDRVEAHWPLRLHLQPGSRVPLHCTASGKLFLSSLRASTQRHVLENLTLERHTPNTITDLRRLKSVLTQIRREKIGTDNEEFLTGLVAVAVPVLDEKRRVCAALAIHGPTARLSLPQALTHVSKLREAANRLSELLIREPALH